MNFIKLTLAPSENLANNEPRVCYIDINDIKSFGDSADPKYGNSFINLYSGSNVCGSVLETPELIAELIEEASFMKK